MLTKNKGQSILEYAILLAVIIAALLVMQMVIKRGAQGQLKDASGKIGEAYSVSGTTTWQKRTMDATAETPNQTIKEEQNTTDKISKVLPAEMASDDLLAGGTLAEKATSYTSRTGGKTVSESISQTEATKKEITRWKSEDGKDGEAGNTYKDQSYNENTSEGEKNYNLSED